MRLGRLHSYGCQVSGSDPVCEGSTDDDEAAELWAQLQQRVAEKRELKRKLASVSRIELAWEAQRASFEQLASLYRPAGVRSRPPVLTCALWDLETAASLRPPARRAQTLRLSLTRHVACMRRCEMVLAWRPCQPRIARLMLSLLATGVSRSRLFRITVKTSARSA